MLKPSLIVAAMLLALPLSTEAQQRARCPAARPDALVIYGEGVSPLAFTTAELRQLAADELRAPDAHGDSPVTYRGAHFWRLLNRAGITGEELRGARLLEYLVAEAADGYRAVLALPEADSMYQSRRVLVAYAADGQPLDAHTGPLQLIVEGDRHQGRWVRQLECVRLGQHSPSSSQAPATDEAP